MQSYTVSVPLVRFAEHYEENIREVKRLGASRVFLCPGQGFGTEAENERDYEALTRAIPIYRAAGLEVGVWISTIGHGGAHPVPYPAEPEGGFTRLVGLKGQICAEDSFCPLGPSFSGAVCRHIGRLAETGPDLIMIDDDYRLGTRGGCGCICDRHMAELRRRLGEDIAPEDVLTKAFTGGPNRYRDTFYHLMGDTLRNFARQMRAAVDRVNPAIRFGACSCITVWDGDGVDSIELAHIMAGKTKPFLRQIGAPYWPAARWSKPADRLAYVIELERMQSHWCEAQGIEVLAEGDVYPRPRYMVPSAYLELFDTALRADNRLDGILKYGVDYNARPLCETGYADRAARNRTVAAEIHRRFAGKSDAGIGVCCTMKKLLGRTIEDPFREIGVSYVHADFYQPEQQLLTNCSLPISYDPSDVCAVMGENAKYIALPLPAGLMLDVKAAQILEERGVDTGLAAAAPLSEKPGLERFYAEDDVAPFALSETSGLMGLTLKPGAEALSEFVLAEPAVSAFRYENTDGTRFLVLGYDAEHAYGSDRFQRSYYRQNQLIRAAEWLGRKPLPAVCPGNPDLYLLCKRGASSMAVGLWNIFPDAVLTPVIALDRAYSRVEFWNASGHLEGSRVCFDRDLPAYAFAGFEVFD